jgi:hypothetical protein
VADVAALQQQEWAEGRGGEAISHAFFLYRSMANVSRVASMSAQLLCVIRVGSREANVSKPSDRVDPAGIAGSMRRANKRHCDEEA